MAAIVSEKPLRIGIVAGEISGDSLGGELIERLRGHFPNAQFEGLGGDTMIKAGLRSLFPMDRLSVMGFIEPLKRLPELLRIRKTLYHHFLDWGADIVVGIDSPDFNLGLELKLRKRSFDRPLCQSFSLGLAPGASEKNCQGRRSYVDAVPL